MDQYAKIPKKGPGSSPAPRTLVVRELVNFLFTADGAKSVGSFITIGSIFPATWDWLRFGRLQLPELMLAFMNILPIPALDGGHVLFLIAR